MKYQENIITEVRKVRHDRLWHVCYLVCSFSVSHKKTPMRETYDRVTQEEAMQVIAEMNKPNSLLQFAT